MDSVDTFGVVPDDRVYVPHTAGHQQNANVFSEPEVHYTAPSTSPGNNGRAYGGTHG